MSTLLMNNTAICAREALLIDDMSADTIYIADTQFQAAAKNGVLHDITWSFENRMDCATRCLGYLRRNESCAIDQHLSSTTKLLNSLRCNTLICRPCSSGRTFGASFNGMSVRRTDCSTRMNAAVYWQ